MDETEEGIQKVQSSFDSSSSSAPKLQSHVPFNNLDIRLFNTSQVRDFSPNFNIENNIKRVGIPPAHPQIPPHSPSSQPSYFSHDSLPPLSPSPYLGVNTDHMIGDTSMEGRNGNSLSLLPPPFSRGNSPRIPESLPPRKTHRRSNSDIPFGFSTILQSSPPLIPLRGSKGVDGSNSVKRELSGRESHGEGIGEMRSEGEVVDDMFSAYMNLNNLGRLNSFRTENCEDLDSRASGTKANGGDNNSDNEATSSVIRNCNNMQQMSQMSSFSDKREGIKRSAGGDIAPTTRHYRSVSMDSVMGKMNFVDESLKLPPSPGGHLGNKPSSNESVDPNSDTFSLEFGNGMFTGAELKKIMANENLAEIALTDPKRVKRILANRQSAARSKERKTRYINELEIKVQTLQAEATTLTNQVTSLQRESASLESKNNELKFRLQAMEKQAQLRNALNEALTSDLERLKSTMMEINGDTAKFSQLSINPQMFQLHHHQHQHQQEQQPQQQQQNGGTTTSHE